MTRLRPLTAKEHAAVLTYARENGRFWKQKLNQDWINARTDGVLHRLRNTHGPSWLASYSIVRQARSAKPNRVITVVAVNGDVFEAARTATGEPWIINYPEGSDRFAGTQAELRSHIRRLMAEGPAAKIAP